MEIGSEPPACTHAHGRRILGVAGVYNTNDSKVYSLSLLKDKFNNTIKMNMNLLLSLLMAPVALATFGEINAGLGLANNIAAFNKNFGASSSTIVTGSISSHTVLIVATSSATPVSSAAVSTPAVTTVLMPLDNDAVIANTFVTATLDVTKIAAVDDNTTKTLLPLKTIGVVQRVVATSTIAATPSPPALV